eukprot:1506281-Amphidinium_carterae.1
MSPNLSLLGIDTHLRLIPSQLADALRLCPRDLRVMPGDCVIDVNGKTEPNAMLEVANLSYCHHVRCFVVQVEGDAGEE